MTEKSELVYNAYDWLMDALDDPDGDILLTSPYLTYRICNEIAASVEGLPFNVVVVTALNAAAVANGYQSVVGLEKLLKLENVTVKHVSHLHAKCFIVGTQAMLGSANLTDAGLGNATRSNHELGVTLAPGLVHEARKTIEGWPAEDVDTGWLQELRAEAKLIKLPLKSAPTPHPIGSEEYDGWEVGHSSQLVEELLSIAGDVKRQLWLKHHFGEPDFGIWRDLHYIAHPDLNKKKSMRPDEKSRPSIGPGDLVVICASGKRTNPDHKRRFCYAVVEVTSETLYKPSFYVEDYADEPDEVDHYCWVNETVPRLVPDKIPPIRSRDLGIQTLGGAGYKRLEFDQFVSFVRELEKYLDS
ncbi:hypothetical protein CPHO_06815 [Corynebacterium phocae]|uniref:Uncharacterized protein n=1 Tax=Corynebacterium phocae TaxID=161895 RepID=A0A1L7D3Z5_9CORY|nr:phospholipase D family protein [Corynebacterium phocae]APT92652.1 hypothetical protein CPHO_06815 [Corynebacterium phocae]KAA8723705.1 hypothetical protein F4V58_06340 [Corynebacterium phocae]